MTPETWLGTFVNVSSEGTGADEKKIYKIRIFTDCKEELILHWGIGKKHISEWITPDAEIRPAHSTDKDGSSQTTFTKDDEFSTFKSINFLVPADKLEIKAINFVLFQPKTVRSISPHLTF